MNHMYHMYHIYHICTICYDPIWQEQWIWRNGLLVRVKSRIEVLTKKVIMISMAFLITLMAKSMGMVVMLDIQVDSFNSSIERAGNADSPYLKVRAPQRIMDLASFTITNTTILIL